MRPPVIVIGMHRSGTSMLTRFIQDLGVFMGKDLSENDESKFFMNLNRWLLFQAGASWDVPRAVDHMDPVFVERSADLAKRRLGSVLSKQYLGFGRFLKYRNVCNIRESWGWKDPRNTLLLPVYQKLFPEARVVHIYRNPIDVAVSLKNRELKIPESEGLSWKERLKFDVLKYERLVAHSLMVEDLDYGVELWDFYTAKACRARDQFQHYCEISYESFLETPKPVLQKLLDFLELEDPKGVANSVAKKVDPSRRYAFLQDPRLVEFYEERKHFSSFKALGYDRIQD